MECFRVLLGLFGLFLHTGAQNNTTSAVARPSYMLLAPTSLRPGLPATVSVTILTVSPVSVVAEIVSGNNSITSSNATINGGSTELLVLPPITQTDNSHYELTVRGYAGGELVFTNSSTLRFHPKSASTFIQTDKPLYRPGHVVKIRAVSVRPDGKPFDSLVDIIVKDPRGNRIRQWLSLDSVLGVVSQQYQLSDNPPLGKWTIHTSVNNDDITSQKHFKVDHYVLPKFEVVISAPPKIFHEDNLWGTVTAKYLYGKPVRGHMDITYVHHSDGIVQSYHESQMIDGNTTFTFEVPDYPSSQFSKRAIEFNDFGDFSSEEFVTVVVNVTESLTGLNSSSTTQVTLARDRYQITFQGCPTFIRPSLNITCQLKVSTYDGLHLPMKDQGKMVTVRLTQQGRGPWSLRFDDTLAMDNFPMVPHPNMSMPPIMGRDMPLMGGMPYPHIPEEPLVEQMEFPVPYDGVVHLFLPLTDDVEIVEIEASFEDIRESLELVRSYSSPSQSYMQIQKPLQSPQVGVPLPLVIQKNFPVSEVHYMVKSRGQIVSAGTGRASVVVTPEESWAPQACIIVYCVLPDGEVVNDVLHLPVAHGLKNQVSVRWSVLRARPADVVTLRLDVLEPGSLVSLLVVDEATRLTGAHNDIMEEQVLEELAGYSSAEDLSSDGLPMADPHSIFTTCDLVVLTDANYQLRKTHQRPEFLGEGGIMNDAMPNMERVQQTDKEPRERWNFPETWLWQDFNISSSVSAEMTVTVPDTITTWTATAFVMSRNHGLGIIQMPAELLVFQDFFLSVNVPAFIIRGEELVLEVAVFNYVNSRQEVMVIVAESKSFEFMNTDNEEMYMAGVRQLYVGSQSGTSVLFPIKPLVLGEIFISVKAVSSMAADIVRKTVLVKPEGLEQSFSSAMLLEFTNASERHLSKELSFTFPADVVRGSERAHVTVFGDILGPSITGLDSLVQMPYGCGEQNMVHFAPNIYVLQYLDATRQADPDIVARATSFMMNGYERQLSYQREDGSFSAFGDHDQSGSTWLSAFVLRCFLQARAFMDVDQRVVQRTAAWLGQRTEEGPDGHFVEPGRVIHTELQGGLEDGPVSLTAYVLMALLEDRGLKNQYRVQVSAALTFLEERLALGISSNYSLCLVSYSLALANSDSAESALQQLMARADMRDGVPFWGSAEAGLTPSWQPRSTSLEMAAYVYLALYKRGQHEQGLPLARWLSQQRNHLGGYASTQDTVLALQALSQFASHVISDGDTDMMVRVTRTEPPGGTVASFRIHGTNTLLHQSQQMETDGSELQLQVTAEGQGFALFQLHVFYNIDNRGLARRRRNNQDEAFHLQVDLNDHDPYRTYLYICTSLSRSHQGVNQTGMALMEVGLLSGFTVAPDGVHTNDDVKKVEMPPGKVILYLDSVTTTEMCIEIPLVLEYKVARVQDANVVIYDYYETSRRTVRSYTSPWRHNASTCWFCGDGCDQCRASQHDQYGYVTSTLLAAAAPADCRHLVVSLLSALLLLLVFVRV